VVDDDEVMRELLPAMLAAQGDEEISVVGSGDEALKWLESAVPEMIMTDLQMPGIEGERLVAALRVAAPPETLLLGMSAARPSQAVLEMLDAFVSKPFGAAELEAAIQTARAAEQAQAKAPRRGHVNHHPVPDVVEEVPILDDGIFSAMASRFDASVLVELYALTLDDVRKRYERIQQLAAAGDLEGYKREAHSIKGACGMVGARELQQLAAVAEGGTSLDTSAIADFPAACDRLRRMLDAKFQVANKGT